MENNKKHKNKKGGEADKVFYIQIGIIAVLLLVIAFNLGKLIPVSGGIGTVSASEIIPQGVPAGYGKELGISYDDITPTNQQLTEATIAKLTKYEDMKLTTEEISRYVKIAGSISCEYCCGAQALIFSNGERACGCAHSYAMRGLAKYLLRNYPDMSDTEILSELGKWKTLFFPSILEGKAEVLKQKGIDPTDYINLASNKYRGIEQGQTSGGQMVGDC